MAETVGLSDHYMYNIDDNLIMASMKEEAGCLAEIAVSLLEALGFVVTVPSQFYNPVRSYSSSGSPSSCWT